MLRDTAANATGNSNTTTEAVLKAAFAQTRMAMVFTDATRPDNPIIEVNRAFCELTGYSEEDTIGRNCRFLQGPDTDTAITEQIRRAIEEERRDYFELLNYRKDGTTFWNALHISPVYNEDGELVRFFGSQWDVTEKVEALQALEGHRRLSDPRLQGAIDEVRRLRAGIDEAREAFLITEYEPISEPGPRIVYASKGFERMSGYTVEEVIGRSPRLLQGPKTDRAVLDEVRAHLEQGEDSRSTATNYRKDGTPFEIEWSITPIHDHEGRPSHWLSVQRDVTEEKKAAERQEMLSAELQHQVRNLFALVMGITNVRGDYPDVKSYRLALRARLQSLIEAHSLVFDSTSDGAMPGEGAPFEPLAEAVLRPVNGSRITMGGEKTSLSSKQALDVALLLHELGTNAVKHGALSVPEGSVELRWRESDGEIEIDWIESGGPEVREPTDSGFGSQLIGMLMQGSRREDAGVEYLPEGLRCRIGLPAR